jgi:hypothetical protein
MSQVEANQVTQRRAARGASALAAMQRFVETDLDPMLDERAAADPIENSSVAQRDEPAAVSRLDRVAP